MFKLEARKMNQKQQDAMKKILEFIKKPLDDPEFMRRMQNKQRWHERREKWLAQRKSKS